MTTSVQSVSPFTSPQIDDHERQQALPGGPTHVVHRGGQSALHAGGARASNEARAWLYTAVDEFSPAYRVGVFLANHARYATKADRQWKVKAGDIFAYWPQKKIAAELGCSVRTIKRGVRSLRQAGVITVRQRVRPYGAACVFVRPGPSGVPSGVPSHREPRTEPRTEETYIRTVSKLTCGPPKMAEKGPRRLRSSPHTAQQRMVAAICGKLGFAVTFVGLEEFDQRENVDKQALIKRLLRVEARHDRSIKSMGSNTFGRPPGPSGPPAAKKPKKTKGKTQAAGPNVPRSGRLASPVSDAGAAGYVVLTEADKVAWRAAKARERHPASSERASKRKLVVGGWSVSRDADGVSWATRR